MFDLWAFLLQTLTASGVAALLLLLKALFQDKLPPKWQFAVWSVLALMLLLPAGYHGRYVLVHWQVPIEMLKAWCGDFGFTQVYFPLPFVKAIPTTVSGWLFVLYTAGVIFFAAKYMLSYISLRQLLRRGRTVQGERLARIEQIADAHDLKLCRVVEVSDLPSAFVCGILRPVLAIPARAEANSTTQDKAYAAERGESTDAMDEKVLLHELFHLKHRDTFWSALICLLRCIHWCNPLLVYCADRALNDMESRCDQYVLEHLEGEARRDYGRILLAMANEKFARTPGSTCINNGGSNIRRRIEAIARFKKYPVGMGLVSVCIVIILAVSLAVGTSPAKAYAKGSFTQLNLASARSIPCTTYAGALDAYAKAILEQSGAYRAMCAPISMQAELLQEIKENRHHGFSPDWDSGLEVPADAQQDYCIYNLTQSGDERYDGLLVVHLRYPPDGLAAEEQTMYLGVQELRVQREAARWVVIPQEDFRYIDVPELDLSWGCTELPGLIYTGEACDMRAQISVQYMYEIDSRIETDRDVMWGAQGYFDTTPKPHAKFTKITYMQNVSCTHLGNAEQRDEIKQIGLSAAPAFTGEKRPQNLPVAAAGYNGSDSDGRIWDSRETRKGWGPSIDLGGGGTSLSSEEEVRIPAYYAAELYLNGKGAAELELRLQEDTK